MALQPDVSRVLVVDDEEQNRHLLVRRLARLGYEVDTAASGPEALAAVAAKPYDVMILDVMMPGMDGFTVLQVLRGSWSKLELPVIMATALDAGRDEVRALDLGANDYVTKPIEFAQLRARLETQLALRREFLMMKREAARAARSTRAMTAGAVLDGRHMLDERVTQDARTVVHRARDMSSGQTVTVIFARAPRTAHAGPRNVALAQLNQDLETVSSIRHPALVRLLGAGCLELEGGWESLSESGSGGGAREDSTPREVHYFVTEQLEGQTLAQVLAQTGPLVLDEALELMVPVIEGVAALHHHGILHGHLDPTSVLVDREAQALQPKVRDAGLARLYRDEDTDAATAGTIERPHYMSPERALGMRNFDARADQFTLAAMLYECLSGVSPFAAETDADVLARITAARFEPLTFLCDVPARFDETIARAMSLDPNERFDDLRAFRLALLHASQGLQAANGDPRDPRG